MKSLRRKCVLVDEWTVSLLRPCRGFRRLEVKLGNVPARDRPFAEALAKLLETYLNRTR